MKTIASGMGLFLAACVLVGLVIFALSIVTSVLIAVLKIGLFVTAGFITYTVGKKLLAKA